MSEPPSMAITAQPTSAQGIVGATSQWTLRQLAKQSEVSEAYLFQRVGEGVTCSAMLGATEPPAIVDWVAERLREAEGPEHTETATLAASARNPNERVVDGKAYRLRLLMTSANDLYGAVVLPQSAVGPSNDVLVGLADRLQRTQ